MTDLITPTAVLHSAVTDPDDDAWHEARALGIGSSDIAAVLGIDPYKTMYGLWLEKTGRADRVKENAAMRAGKAMEQGIATLYEHETGKRTTASPGILRRVDIPWALCSPDRMVVEPAGPNDLSFVGFLECKNVSGYKADGWDPDRGILPPHFHVQVLWQLLVTGYWQADIAALVGGNSLKVLHVDWDGEVGEYMLGMAEAFMWAVHHDEEPAYDNDARSLEVLKRLRVEQGSQIVIDGAGELYQRIARAKAATSEARAKVKECEDAERLLIGEAQSLMGEHEVAVDADGVPLFTWKLTHKKASEATSYRTFRLASR